MICCNIYSALTPTKKKKKCVDCQKFLEQQQYVMSYSYSFSFCVALSHCETFWYESECGSGSSDPDPAQDPARFVSHLQFFMHISF
jgi:hypothetical protein